MLSLLSGRSRTGRAARAARCRLALEPLESRLVPYALSGYTWANPNVSVSFMPDGTLISSGYPSDLFAVYNAAYPQATWQYEVAKALQAWADVSNLNFHFVADDGSPQGTAGLAQGDSRFGDIRIGGFNMGSGILGMGWNPSATATTGGDVALATASAFPIGSIPDLSSVMMHEVGHAIGFNHSLVDPAVMEGGLWGTYAGPYADDVAGVQAMYGARRPDAYDAVASNNSLAAATALTLAYGGVTLSGDITTLADIDYYKVVAPAGADGTFTVSVDARNLSLFNPRVSVFDSSGTLLATASASSYGGVATVTLSGLVAGGTYYLMASGASTDVFGMGAYKLTAQFGGLPAAPAIGPDAFEPNNTAGTAANLGKVSSTSQTGLTFHTSTDVDYYSFVAANKGSFAVSIAPAQGSGAINVVVLSAQQTVLASGRSASGGVTVSLSLASGQQYVVQVSSPTGSLLAYTLTIGQSGNAGQAGGSAKTGGGKHLVVSGATNPDDPGNGDVFYQNAADDPDHAGIEPRGQRGPAGALPNPAPVVVAALLRATPTPSVDMPAPPVVFPQPWQQVAAGAAVPSAKAAQVIAGSGLLVALVESDSEEESEAVPADHSVPNALPARNLADVRPYDFAGAPRLRR